MKMEVLKEIVMFQDGKSNKSLLREEEMKTKIIHSQVLPKRNLFRALLRWRSLTPCRDISRRDVQPEKVQVV